MPGFYIGKWTINSSRVIATAARFRKWKMVTELANQGANVNLKDARGVAAIHYAADDGQAEIIKLLIAANADVNLRGTRGRSALHCASRHGNVSIVQTLLKAQADVNHQGENGCTPLQEACQSGHLPVVSELIRAKAALDLAEQSGWTAMHFACRSGHLRVVNLLVAARADVNAEIKSGCSPLHFACLFGHVNIVKMLISAKADVNQQEIKGRSALQLACYKGVVETIKLLLAENASMNHQSTQGHTPVHTAVRFSNTKVLKCVLAANPDLSIVSSSQSSALDTAAYLGDIPGLRLMLQHIIKRKLNVCHFSNLSPNCTTLLLRCIDLLEIQKYDRSKSGISFANSDSKTRAAVDDNSLSIQLHSAMQQAGFHSNRSALQAAVADVLQDIERMRQNYTNVFIVGSFADGWGNSLTSMNGSTEIDSDIDVIKFVNGRGYCIESCCRCKQPKVSAVYENGHVTCDGQASKPSKRFRGSLLRPAFDMVRAYKCCSYPFVKVIHDSTHKSHLSEKQMKLLRDCAADSYYCCHLVNAAPPSQQGTKLRVSTTFLELPLMRSLSTVQGQLFILLKYLIKREIGSKVKGFKTYTAKSLVFYMLDTRPSTDWQPCNLLQLVRDSLRLLADFLSDSEAVSNNYMPHFFLRDAAIFLKDSDDEKRDLKKEIEKILTNLPEIVQRFMRNLNCDNNDSGVFYLHPFLIIPDISQQSDIKHKQDQVKYHEIYDSVRKLLQLLSTKHSEETQIAKMIDQIPDCARTTRESLRALKYMKFKEMEQAEHVLQSYLDCNYAVARGIATSDLDEQTANTGSVWQHLKQSDSAWKFCFRLEKRPTMDYLPQNIRQIFPTKINNYRTYYFMNFDALMKSLCFQLIGDSAVKQRSAHSWFSGVVRSDRADVQELLVMMCYCKDKDLMVELVHSHRRDVANHLSSVDKLESLMKEWPELREASTIRSIQTLNKRLANGGC